MHSQFFCHIDEFRLIFDLHCTDIILVSKSWLKPEVSDRAVELPGYNIYRNDRQYARGGGVAAYVKSQFQTSILHCSDTSRAARPEHLFLDVCVNGTHVLVGVCYRAPGLGYLAEFEHVLLDLMARYSHVIVMGDFNTQIRPNLLDYDVPHVRHDNTTDTSYSPHR